MPKPPEMEEIKLSMGNEALNIPKKASRCQKELLFYQNHKYLFVSSFLQITLKSHYMVFTLKSIVSFLSDSKCVSLTPAYSNIFLLAFTLSVSLYLSLMYTTSLIPH